jgi:NAD(P)-dependent dehydrogenase (short-subunit alcohol dehydrogenase family)
MRLEDKVAVITGGAGGIGEAGGEAVCRRRRERAFGRS